MRATVSPRTMSPAAIPTALKITFMNIAYDMSTTVSSKHLCDGARQRS